jgi:phage gpG-like protein
MTFEDLETYLTSLPDLVLDAVPDLIAETATQYFRARFNEKSFAGKPWAPLKKGKNTGSLLVESGNLVGSIFPAYIGRDRVIISAGNDKVPYAQVHNEGFTGPVTIPAHTRTSKKGKKYDVGSHTIQQKIPQRQYMGKNDELAGIIHDRIVDHLNSIL